MAFAAEEIGEISDDPLGVYAEFVGIVIGIGSIAIFWRTIKGVGGTVGNGLRMVIYAIAVITLGIITKAVGEIIPIAEERFVELLFEGFVVLGMILMVVAGRKLAQLSKT